MGMDTVNYSKVIFGKKRLKEKTCMSEKTSASFGVGVLEYRIKQEELFQRKEFFLWKRIEEHQFEGINGAE